MSSESLNKCKEIFFVGATAFLYLMAKHNAHTHYPTEEGRTIGEAMQAELYNFNKSKKESAERKFRENN